MFHFVLLVCNRANRYHLVTQAICATAPRDSRVAIRASERVLFYEYLLRNFGREIRETGQDPEVIRDWKWTRCVGSFDKDGFVGECSLALRS
jgi:hypothetical protein